MHADLPPASPDSSTNSAGPWYRELTRYHWFVFVVAALGWLFDTMDQQLFTLARPLAMEDLIQLTPEEIEAARTIGAQPDEEPAVADKRVTDKLTAKRTSMVVMPRRSSSLAGQLVACSLACLATAGDAFAPCWSRSSCTRSSLV